MCLLCADLERDLAASGIARLYGSSVLEQSILWQDEQLYLTPAPGNIVPGYLILATKRHVKNFATLPEYLLQRVALVLRAIRSEADRLGLAPCVSFEHGAVSMYSRGAACVDHAHIHICPSPDAGELFRFMKKHFAETEIPHLSDLTTVSGTGTPYIWLNTPNRMCSYQVEVAPSQLLRQCLADQWNLTSCWDWRSHPMRENYLETLRLFTKLKGATFNESLHSGSHHNRSLW